MPESSPRGATSRDHRRKVFLTSKTSQGTSAFIRFNALSTSHETQDGTTTAGMNLQNDISVFTDVILPPLELDPDEEELRKFEERREIRTAMEKVSQSGKLSITEVRLIAPELRKQKLFEGASDEMITASMRHAYVISAKRAQILWTRRQSRKEDQSSVDAQDGTFEAITGSLKEKLPFCLVLQGEVHVIKRKKRKGALNVSAGCAVAATDKNVLGFIAAEEDTSILVGDCEMIQEALRVAKKSKEAVLGELRRLRPLSTWTEENATHLFNCLRDLPFFEDHEPGLLRRISRLLRYRCLEVGDPFPFRGRSHPTSPHKADEHEDGLIVFFHGSAGIYEEVAEPVKDAFHHSVASDVVSRLGSLLLERSGSIKPTNTESIPPPRSSSSFSRCKDLGGFEALQAAVEAAAKRRETKKPDAGNIRSLRRSKDVSTGTVFGEHELIEPEMGSSVSYPIIRCEGQCEVLLLSRSDYLRIFTEHQLERQRIIYALRAVPPSHPGEPHLRSEEQLELLTKTISKCPEFADFPRSTLMQVVGAATYLHTSPEKVLCRQGDTGDRLFAIIEGRVSIHVESEADRLIDRPISVSAVKYFEEEWNGSIETLSAQLRYYLLRDPLCCSDDPHDLSQSIERLAPHPEIGSDTALQAVPPLTTSRRESRFSTLENQDEARVPDFTRPQVRRPSFKAVPPLTISRREGRFSTLETKDEARVPDFTRPQVRRPSFKAPDLTRPQVRGSFLKDAHEIEELHSPSPVLKRSSTLKVQDTAEASQASGRRPSRLEIPPSLIEDKDEAEIKELHSPCPLLKRSSTLKVHGPGKRSSRVDIPPSLEEDKGADMQRKQVRRQSFKVQDVATNVVRSVRRRTTVSEASPARNLPLRPLSATDEEDTNLPSQKLSSPKLVKAADFSSSSEEDETPDSSQKRLSPTSLSRLVTGLSAVPTSLGKSVNRLGAGSVFGTLSLQQNQARTASVVTMEASKLLVVTREDYNALMNSKDEAAARDGAQFLCRHLMGLEQRGPGNILDRFPALIQQKLEQVARHMKAYTLERGTVLVQQGSTKSEYAWLLRKGLLAISLQASQKGATPHPSRLRLGKSSASCVTRLVSSAGELIGSSMFLLKVPEPATVRVESAAAELYRVPWAELQKVLSPKALEHLKSGMEERMTQRNLNESVETAKERLQAITAKEKGLKQDSDKLPEAVETAIDSTFEAAIRLVEAHDKGFRKPPLVSKKPRGTADDKGTPGKESYKNRVMNALTALEEVQQDTSTFVSPKPSKQIQPRAPPDTSASHVRALMIQALREDTSEAPSVVKRHIREAMSDPEKGNLKVWIEKNIFRPRVMNNAELQDLHLLARRQLRDKRSVSR